MDVSRKVYFARCIGPTGVPMGAYKIGCSYGWNDRIKTVTANLPFTLEVAAVVPGSMFMEAAVHLYLKAHRIAGEYFYANEAVERFVQRAAERGEAFNYIFDLGSDYSNDGTVEAFLHYHGVSLKEACLRAGTDPKRFEAMKVVGKNRRVLVGAALVAAERGQVVHWPDNVIEGLLGHQAPMVLQAQEEAAEQEAAA
jgi:hypothetical protein